MNGFGRTFALTILLVLSATVAAGQIQKNQFPVRIEVLIQPTPQHNLKSRAWTPIFQQLGQPITFRNGRSGERVSLLETDTAGRKGVRVIGMLNNDGTIRFPGKTFNQLKSNEVADWLTRLKMHGARGPVNEDASWGLDNDDFKVVLNLLAEKVEAPIKDQSVIFAIESLDLPKAFRVQFTPQARLKAARPATKIGGTFPDCSQLSKGSALAVVLAQFGLGFRPKKTDKGAFILEVDVGDEADNLYPIGWKNQAPITSVVKNLVKRFDVALDNQNVNLVIQLLAKKLELPFAYSSDVLIKNSKNPDELKYSRKSGKTSAYRLMESIEGKHALGLSFRTDEAGQVFLWVTTKENKKAFDQRFAHVKPTVN